MDGNGKKIENRFLGIVIQSSLIISFLVFCNYSRLTEDYQTADWSSLAVRVSLILVLAFFAGFRVREFLSWKTSTDRRNSLLIILFLTVLFYPFLSHVSFLSTSVKSVSAHVWRKQHQKDVTAVVNSFKAFPGVYKEYRRQHLKLSRAFIHLDSLVKVYLLGVSPNTKIALGKNGFFFEGYGARKVEKGIIEKFDNIADYMGQIPFSEDDLRQWKRTLEERSYWLKQQGSEFVFVLAPTKGFVYPEFLPDKLTSKKAETRYEQLSRYLREETDIYFVDLLPALLDAKKEREYPFLFYKTDFHWNYYGSFVAYREVIRKLRDFFPQYATIPLEFDDFEMDINEKWAHRRFMQMIGLPVFLHKNEHYITMVPKPDNVLSTVKALPAEGVHDVNHDKTTVTNSRGEKMDILLIRNPEAPVPSVLLLGDSFFEKCILYFSSHFQEVYNYRTIVNFPRNIFRFVQPSIVVQEILNMFILRAPPVNPLDMQMAYLQHKYNGAESSFYVATKHERASFGRHVNPGSASAVLLPQVKMMNSQPVVAKLSVHTDNEGVIVIQQGASGKNNSKGEYPLVAGENDIYIELPVNTAISRLSFSWKELKQDQPQVMGFELRVVDGL